MTIAIYDIQAILVNGVMKAVGSGKICKKKGGRDMAAL